jgi:hypothetical protein
MKELNSRISLLLTLIIAVAQTETCHGELPSSSERPHKLNSQMSFLGAGPGGGSIRKTAVTKPPEVRKHPPEGVEFANKLDFRAGLGSGTDRKIAMASSRIKFSKKFDFGAGLGGGTARENGVATS